MILVYNISNKTIVKNRLKSASGFLLAAMFLFSFFLFSPLVQAADLKLSPSGDYYQVGDNISVTAQVVSPDESANAVYGVINFPSNKLQVTSISKADSIVNLWVQDPTYSNSQGQVTFEGAILNPGFTGESGQLITINFRAKSAGSVKLAFSDGSILANDGQGTNILDKLGATVFNIVAKEDITKVAKKEDNRTAKTNSMTTTMATTTVDNTPPQLEINQIKTPADDRASFVFSGTDVGSGIDHYEFQLDDTAIQQIPDDGTNLYTTPELNVGEHTLIVTAIDKAGNRAKRQLNFGISLPIVSSLWATWGESAIFALSLAVPLACLLIILLMVLVLGWQKVSAWKKKMRREVREAEENMHKTFDLIREDLQINMILLEKAKSKRKLTLIEKKMLKTIKNDLTEAEKYLKQEIEDIEKQIN